MRKAGVDKNVRGVIFVHSVSGDIDFRYDHVDEAELLDAIDRSEAFLENVSQATKRLNQKNKNRSEAYIFVDLLRVYRVSIILLGYL